METKAKTNPLAGMRVMVVDDDPVSLKLFATYLRRAGFEVLPMRSGKEAVEFLSKEPQQSVEVVLTDYRMPQMSGLDLIHWVREFDESLACIVVTAEGEKRLVAESMRTGAVDFLEKPVPGAVLVESVGKAAMVTKERRELQSQLDAVREVGAVKTALQRVRTVGNLPSPKLAAYANADVGGDFLEVFSFQEGGATVLCGDVSGHDLKAGYISAYFQGLVHGLLAKGAQIAEIATYFNRHLLKEWNSETPDRVLVQGISTRFSISACFINYTAESQVLEALNCGVPAPILVRRSGVVEVCPDSTQPLGWFEDLELPVVSTRLEPGDVVYLFTDGLEDLAQVEGLNVISLAALLLKDSESSGGHPILTRSRDDVMAFMWSPHPHPLPRLPVLAQRYGSEDLKRIDEWQEQWERSLRLLFPKARAGDRLFDILVCTREALINALKHGAPHLPVDAAFVSMLHDPATNELFVRVSDRGKGHDFDLDQRIEDCESLREYNLGLTMLRALCDDFKLEHRGATVKMTFKLES